MATAVESQPGIGMRVWIVIVAVLLVLLAALAMYSAGS